MAVKLSADTSGNIHGFVTGSEITEYYNIRNVLSKQFLLNFIIGVRGNGKTYALKCFTLDDYLKSVKERDKVEKDSDGAITKELKYFGYVRRFSSDIDEITDYWSDIRHKYPEHELEQKGNVLYVDGEIAGYLIALTTFKKIKSKGIKLYNIVFDEFLPEESTYGGYLKREVDIFLNMIDTLVRNDIFRVFCIANTVKLINPYFEYFGLDIDTNKRFTLFRDRLICVELLKEKGFIEQRKKTAFGRLTNGTPYSDYALDGKFSDENNNFIGDRDKSYKPFFNIKFKGEMFGVWRNDDDEIFVDDKYEPTLKNTFVNNLDDADNETAYKNILRTKNSKYIFDVLYQAIQNNKLYYKDIKVREYVIEYFTILGLYRK